MPDKNPMLRLEMASVPERPTNWSIVEACSLLNSLDRCDRERLANSSYTAYAERGELIWMAGSPAQFVALVGAGFVKMTKSAPSGQEVAVELLGPGQCFGLFAVLEGRSYPLTAVAVTNCWYLKIPTRVIHEVYRESVAFKDQVVRGLAPRLRRAHDMMCRLSSGRVEERLAAVVFLLADAYGERVPEGLRIAVPLTRQDLSEMAGTTVETTIRVLSRWQKEGILCTRRHVLTIVDEARLLHLLQG